MIKLFGGGFPSGLESEVNDYIKNCGCKIHSIQYTTLALDNQIIYTCCIVIDTWS